LFTSGHGVGIMDLYIILTHLYSSWHLANVRKIYKW
jgi:hypothetical protein